MDQPAPREPRPRAGSRFPAPAHAHLGAIMLGASLVLVALNLRAAITSIGPVLPELMQLTGLSTLGASILTTLPPLCFGLAGALAPSLAGRLGAERAVLVALVALALGEGIGLLEKWVGMHPA